MGLVEFSMAGKIQSCRHEASASSFTLLLNSGEMSQQAQQAGAAGGEKKREEKPQFPAPKFDIDTYSKTYTGHGRINRLKFIGEVRQTEVVFITYMFVVLQGCCPYCV